ncbi:hypothetical protein E2C01_002757 [Portunus trituberculatus]|uniref:Uncharacterized protein n=1 Tax=Portunus trituberculatus TaxID=210409 RepID=A0A5B7CKL0_PORTR|nr:hypothetical protein [Portunus trituberculatus]
MVVSRRHPYIRGTRSDTSSVIIFLFFTGGAARVRGVSDWVTGEGLRTGATVYTQHDMMTGTPDGRGDAGPAPQASPALN